jgi:hypothetical protein
MMPNIKIKAERQYSAHHSYFKIAKDSLSLANEKGPKQKNHVMIAIVFSALSLEAICNFIGDLIIEDWQDYESCNPKSKLRVISACLVKKMDKNIEPWASVYWLMNLRNKIAHPKPQKLKSNCVISVEDFDKYENREPPQADLERQFVTRNAKRAVDAVDALLKVLYVALPEDSRFGVIAEMWESHEEYIPDGG